MGASWSGERYNNGARAALDIGDGSQRRPPQPPQRRAVSIAVAAPTTRLRDPAVLPLPDEWQELIDDAISRGMPNPADSEYRPWAEPIPWGELSTSGWDARDHGMPAYITLRGFGGGEILATTRDGSGNPWCAVIIFHISSRTDRGHIAPDAVSTIYGRIKWGMPWKVRSEQVRPVMAIVKDVTTPYPTSGPVVSLLQRDITVTTPKSGTPRSFVAVIPWIDFLSHGDSTASVLHEAVDLFRRDFTDFFAREPHEHKQPHSVTPQPQAAPPVVVVPSTSFAPPAKAAAPQPQQPIASITNPNATEAAQQQVTVPGGSGGASAAAATIVQSRTPTLMFKQLTIPPPK